MPPQSQGPDFGFMLNNQQPVRRRIPLPNLNLPKPAKIAIWAIGGIIVLVIIVSVLSGGNSSSFSGFIGVLARGQETLRVTQEVQQLQLQEPDTQALAATISSSLSSDQAQIKEYLARNHIGVSSADLAADTNKSTDTSIQNALQDNNLDGAYVTYLKGALTRYEQDLQNAYKAAGPNGKQLLSSAYQSAQVLLNNPPIKS